MVLTTVACYLLCWMPYGVVAMMATFGPPNIITPVASVVPSLLAKSSTVINPLIYILMNKQVSQHHVLRWVNFKPLFWKSKTVRHVQQVYLQGKKRRITTAEIIQMVFLNINPNILRWKFIDKSNWRRKTLRLLDVKQDGHSYNVQPRMLMSLLLLRNTAVSCMREM